MNVYEFMNIKERYCKFLGHNCRGCIFEDCKSMIDDDCNNINEVFKQKRIRALRSWAEDHPVVTVKDAFKKCFPNASIVHDTLFILPCMLTGDIDDPEVCPGGASMEYCEECQERLWNKEWM